MREITFYNFTLEKSAEENWGPIFDHYSQHLPKFQEELLDILNGFGYSINLGKPFFHTYDKNNVMFYNEIKYIAERIGLSAYQVLLMQLIYETTSACTTSVFNIKGSDFFLRTMDWPMPFLKDITIGLNIISNGVEIGKVVTWLGYVGFLTVNNTNKNYTIAINYRRTKDMGLVDIVKNFYRVISLKWPIGYLVRHIVTQKLGKNKAFNLLKDADLVSPCYITFHLPNKNTYIITRDCDEVVDVRKNNLVQTNCDWNKSEPDILYSIERRKFIEEMQEYFANTEEDLSVEQILHHILKFPVINEETIYTYYQYGSKIKTFV